MASNRFTSRSTFLKRVEIPEGIPVGAVIGKGGSICKAIVAAHRVRYQVDSEARVVMISGSPTGVDGAVSDLLELLEGLQSHNDASKDRSNRLVKPIHVVAVTRHGRESTWRFESVSADESAVDPNVEEFPYRLTEHGRLEDAGNDEGEDSDDEDTTAKSWVSEFSPTFHQRMVREVVDITRNLTLPIKIKAAFGQTCFALPDTTLANGPLLPWEELQQLEMFDQLKPRWSNVGNNQSMTFSKLVGKLEALYTPETTFRHDLTVYINSCNCVGRQLDISVKFRREDGDWVPVVRRPVRVVYALYNIAVDNDTAFRIRVYSRDNAPEDITYADLASHLEVSERLSGDLFSTEVKPLPGFPSDLAIRTFAVKEKTRVHWQGLRFAVSYMDATHQSVSLACTQAHSADDGDTLSPADVLDELVDKLTEKLKP